MPYILNTQSSAQCTHGGTVQLTSTSNAVMKVDQAFALLQTDIPTVSGCPFMKGPTPSPCLMVTWVSGATQTKVNQTPVLLDTSVGLCQSATGPQGTVMITNVQSKVQGL
jgi:hypothetical protein